MNRIRIEFFKRLIKIIFFVNKNILEECIMSSPPFLVKPDLVLFLKRTAINDLPINSESKLGSVTWDLFSDAERKIKIGNMYVTRSVIAVSVRMAEWVIVFDNKLCNINGWFSVNGFIDALRDSSGLNPIGKYIQRPLVSGEGDFIGVKGEMITIDDSADTMIQYVFLQK